MSLVAVLVHDDTPPSLNAISGHTHWRVYAGHKKRWQKVFTDLLLYNEVPQGLARVAASGSIRFPDRRKRDQGNFRVLIEKALGDALVGGGWLPDDDWDHYSFGDLFKESPEKPGQTTVTLRYD